MEPYASRTSRVLRGFSVLSAFRRVAVCSIWVMGCSNVHSTQMIQNECGNLVCHNNLFHALGFCRSRHELSIDHGKSRYSCFCLRNSWRCTSSCNCSNLSESFCSVLCISLRSSEVGEWTQNKVENTGK